jgi:acetyltransferase
MRARSGDMNSAWQLRLGDGARVILRPIRVTDAAGFARAYSQLGELSRQRRFMSVAHQLTPAELRYLTSVDHRDHEALVAVDPSSGEILGSARYVRDPDCPDEAELAVEVIDEWQRRGVGRGLVEVLSTIARANGVTRFTAIVAIENVPVQLALRGAGATARAGVGAGELDYTIDLEAALAA